MDGLRFFQLRSVAGRDAGKGGISERSEGAPLPSLPATCLLARARH